MSAVDAFGRPYTCDRPGCAYLGTVMPSCPCSHELRDLTPLIGKVVASARIEYTTLTIEFTDGTVIEATGYSAQGEDALSVTEGGSDGD